MAVRKIELMHRMFGKDEAHKCGECNNLCTFRYRDKTYRKCEIYGVTHSQASDWAKRWTACGLFNGHYHGDRVINYVRPDRPSPPIESDPPLENQISLFEEG